jgi:FkbM family methyltransferase
MYYSQYKQDEHIDKYFNQKINGVFLDIGAGDGVIGSNSCFFEKERNWTGICIEPSKIEYDQLKINRKCITVECAICDKEGESKFLEMDGYTKGLSGLVEHYNPQHKHRIESERNHFNCPHQFRMVKTMPIQKILDQYNIFNIDFLSLDVEGAELSVLKTFDLNKTNIKLMTIENNYGETDVSNYLLNNGYKLLGKIAIDDVFVKKD